MAMPSRCSLPLFFTDRTGLASAEGRQAIARFHQAAKVIGRSELIQGVNLMMRLIKAAFAMLAALAALQAPPSAAKNVVADVDQLASVMKDAGYKVEIKDMKGERFIAVESSGYKYAIFPFGCDDAGKNCKSVQFFVAFDPKSSPTLEQMNGYAREYRWGRVYLDKDGDPAVEFDLDLEKGGMSAELFLDNVEYWEAIMVAYADWVFGGKDEKK